MHSSKLWVRVLIGAAAWCACAATALAQETPSPASAVTPTPTLLDQQYDGKTHVTVAPYIWGPTVKGDFQFSIPTLPGRHGHGRKLLQSSVQIGPSEYVPKLNSAAMVYFDARNRDIDVFGDVIYLNASTTATIVSTVGGPLGKIQLPVTVNSDARLSLAIWEAAAGFTLAHGDNADVSMFLGVREFPLNLNISYNATIGKRGLIAPSGTATPSDRTNDVIWGIRGRAFFGDQERWYVPYYFDVGSGSNNQTWQAYGGAGYAFPHGQSILALWRALNYNTFPPVSHTQKLSMGGPLLGYSFGI